MATMLKGLLPMKHTCTSDPPLTPCRVLQMCPDLGDNVEIVIPTGACGNVTCENIIQYFRQEHLL